MILDTTFLIDILRNKQEASDKLKSLEKLNVPIAVAAPSIVEIFAGWHYSKKSDEEKGRIIDVLESQVIHDLDKESARKAGEIKGNLIKTGNDIELMDCMIAGIAYKNKETILTRNVKHFSKIKGINVETY